jgi:hypothetical protein
MIFSSWRRKVDATLRTMNETDLVLGQRITDDVSFTVQNVMDMHREICELRKRVAKLERQ